MPTFYEGEMSDEQKYAIRTALADLIGSLQAKNNLDFFSHDWKGHLESIYELAEAFPELAADYQMTMPPYP